MASKDIKQSHMVLLYQSMILSVIDYGPGLTTLSQSNLLKIDRVQNEAMGVILGKNNLHNPACVQSRRVQASKGLGKTFKGVQALLHDSENLGTHCREWPAGKANRV